MGKTGGGGALPPTSAMKQYVVSLSQQKGIAPSVGYATSGVVCRAFLDQHASGKGSLHRTGTKALLSG